MVWTRVMEWLRTPLTIFRQAVWVETCCYAPKVWYFQSGARSTSYCRAVNSFEMFSFLFFWCPLFSTFCPTVAEESVDVKDFKVGGIFKGWLHPSFPHLSHYQLHLNELILHPPPSPTSNSADNFAPVQPRRLPATSQDTAAITEIVAATDARFSAPISWVVYCIDVFCSHRLWPWGRTAVVTTTFWPIL